MTKFAPFTVRVNAGPPAKAEVGASEVMEGPLTVNAEGAEVMSERLLTVTLVEPGVVMAATGMVTLICVALVLATAMGVAPKFTVTFGEKPVPVMVRATSATP
ncbi:MAG: hypothetical protein IPJ98_09620 [Bryobacterales bacterium]|nr:hypothetical protein [Bryobacterales bacterium]